MKKRRPSLQGAVWSLSLVLHFVGNAHVPMGCEGFAKMLSEASDSSFGLSPQSKLYSREGLMRNLSFQVRKMRQTWSSVPWQMLRTVL